MIKHSLGILALFTLLASCYKVEEPIPTNTRLSQDTATFTIIGGGFNEAIITDRVSHMVFSDPSTGEEGSRIKINGRTPVIEITLENHLAAAYTIDGNQNRAYLFTDNYIGDAISGTVTITKRTGTVYFAGIFDLSFRNNSINPTDTIIVQGTYFVNQ